MAETVSDMDGHSVAAPAAPTAGPAATSEHDNATHSGPSMVPASGLSAWAKSLKISQPSSLEASGSGNLGKSVFSRFTSGIGLRLSPKAPETEENAGSPSSTSAQTGVFGTITKGLVDSSKSAVKAVQVKARHIVSQNKRRYQEGGFDLDMTYITENIIAMGFPAGDMSSGFFGYVEGFYRNHMEEVIKFFETHHQGKYKVYNLCSERLYDASLFEGKVACFPFDDHNCPPTQLIISFCQSAYSWLKTDIENVVVVHCKAGMARTGLMISSLLLYLKFFPTAEESIDYYNQKRCFDGKGLVLPSQIRYVKYFERILTYFNGENQPGRRCMLRGFRLHRCPYWIRPSITVSNHDGILFSTKKHPRTKDLGPEDFWFTAPRKGIMVFALPGEPGLAELCGDFKVHFHDRQGDFYCWLNTTMMENRKVLTTSDLDGFDKRKLPSPGFQLEIVVADYDGSIPSKSKSEEAAANADNEVSNSSSTAERPAATLSEQNKNSSGNDNDDNFSDDEVDEASKNSRTRTVSESGKSKDEIEAATHGVQQLSLKGQMTGSAQVLETTKKVDDANKQVAEEPKLGSGAESEFKAIAADASVFTFGDDDDFESD